MFPIHLEYAVCYINFFLLIISTTACFLMPIYILSAICLVIFLPLLSNFIGNHNQRHNDFLLAQELERRERERLKFEEKKEFDQLRAQFGMDNDGNFHTQSISNMQNAVYRGEMSVVDYYERQVSSKNSRIFLANCP